MVNRVGSTLIDIANSCDAPSLSDRLRLLAEEERRNVFLLNACLEKTGGLHGRLCHQILGEWLASDLKTESELQEWLNRRFGPNSEVCRFFHKVAEQADLWCKEDFKVAVWRPGIPHADDVAPGCPQVLFVKGSLGFDTKRAAVFNSRKPRVVSPHENWLQIIRAALPLIKSSKAGVMGSFGTITYDLVTTYALEHALDLLLLVPFPIESSQEYVGNRVLKKNYAGCTVLSCLTRAAKCSKATRMVCRDRLIAALSDFHLVIEVRSRGNIARILERQQKEAPRPQSVYRPPKKSARTEGNMKLLANFPDWSKPFFNEDINIPQAGLVKKNSIRTGVQSLQEPDWNAYLYHYTRACPGPWPGQHYREYLSGLLDGYATAGHTALDTLMRIISEGRIRSGSMLIRGGDPVVCWSARPPLELESIRKWNPALIRWTFEPYGIAVKRKVLRRCGAKPTIYGNSKIYKQLKDSERYRFQKHEPPECRWKHEREWRIQNDVLLDNIPVDEWIIFVPDRDDAEKLSLQLGISLPIVILSQNDVRFSSEAMLSRHR
ncbi:MAG: hypothetical protein AB2L11_04965 [Syntrophobacteraceae bacterium]